MIVENKSLKNLNTFGIDVCAKYYAEFKNVEELEDILNNNRDKNIYILGGGSNTLFTKDFDGLIIRSVATNIAIVDKNMVCAEAGLEWDLFVGFCVENRLYGAENLSLIPGTVGASPVQNIGAYGSEAKDIIESVKYYDIVDRCVRVIQGSECCFGYRDSIFKRELMGRIVVLEVLFRLNNTFTPNIKYGNIERELDPKKEITAEHIRETIIRIREQKLPNPKVIGNGGSFFKNPIVSSCEFELLKSNYADIPSYKDEKGVKIPAGWLIERAGWKGYREGDAGVHINQALVLVNYGGASGVEVVDLAKRIIEDVEAKFGIKLTPEINILC